MSLMMASTSGWPSGARYSSTTRAMPFAPSVSSRIEYVKTGITLRPAASRARIRASSIAQLDEAQETREKRTATHGPSHARGAYHAR